MQYFVFDSVGKLFSLTHALIVCLQQLPVRRSATARDALYQWTMFAVFFLRICAVAKRMSALPMRIARPKQRIKKIKHTEAPSSQAWQSPSFVFKHKDWALGLQTPGTPHRLNWNVFEKTCVEFTSGSGGWSFGKTLFPESGPGKWTKSIGTTWTATKWIGTKLRTWVSESGTKLDENVLFCSKKIESLSSIYFAVYRNNINQKQLQSGENERLFILFFFYKLCYVFIRIIYKLILWIFANASYQHQFMKKYKALSLLIVLISNYWQIINIQFF